MHQTLHVERHFTASELVRDIVIGMSDGLTVPFALAAGLSGTEHRDDASSSRPAWPRWPRVRSPWAWGATWPPGATPSTTPARSAARRSRSSSCPTSSARRSPSSSASMASSEAEIEPILQAFEKNHPAWVDFMMRFELGLEEPDPRRALQERA